MKKIKFEGFWVGFKNDDNFITKILKKYNYNFSVVENDPDILIFSILKGKSYINNLLKKYSKCKLIFYTGENSRCIENIHLNLTFDNTNLYNNIRLPLWFIYWVRYGSNKNIILSNKEIKGFCSFVYSRNVKYRNSFCKKLAKYKKIGCGGGSLNNLGGRVKNKITFQNKFKFCIAFEHISYPGYATEKILEAYISNCIPIYYGSETIEDDFNSETFINSNNFKDDNEMIEYIKKVDNNDDLYNSFLNKPIFSKKWLDIMNDPEEKFLKNIAKKIIE